MKSIYTGLMLLTASIAHADTWTIIDNKNKSILFEFKATPSEYGGEKGQFQLRDFSAEITFDPDNLEQSNVSVVINTVDYDNSGDYTIIEQNYDKPHFFDSENYQTATFTSSSFESLGAGEYVATGDLTVKGISQEISFEFEPNIQG